MSSKGAASVHPLAALRGAAVARHLVIVFEFEFVVIRELFAPFDIAEGRNDDFRFPLREAFLCRLSRPDVNEPRYTVRVARVIDIPSSTTFHGCIDHQFTAHDSKHVTADPQVQQGITLILM